MLLKLNHFAHLGQKQPVASTAPAPALAPAPAPVAALLHCYSVTVLRCRRQLIITYHLITHTDEKGCIVRLTLKSVHRSILNYSTVNIFYLSLKLFSCLKTIKHFILRGVCVPYETGSMSQLSESVQCVRRNNEINIFTSASSICKKRLTGSLSR